MKIRLPYPFQLCRCEYTRIVYIILYISPIKTSSFLINSCQEIILTGSKNYTIVLNLYGNCCVGLLLFFFFFSLLILFKRNSGSIQRHYWGQICVIGLISLHAVILDLFFIASCNRLINCSIRNLWVFCCEKKNFCRCFPLPIDWTMNLLKIYLFGRFLEKIIKQSVLQIHWVIHPLLQPYLKVIASILLQLLSKFVEFIKCNISFAFGFHPSISPVSQWFKQASSFSGVIYILVWLVIGHVPHMLGCGRVVYNCHCPASPQQQIRRFAVQIFIIKC